MRDSGPTFYKLVTRVGETERVFEVAGEHDRYRVRTDSSERSFEWTSLGHGRFLFTVEGRPHLARIHRSGSDEYTIETAGEQVVVRASDELSARAARVQQSEVGAAGPVEVLAPMPGTVLQVLVSEGDAVARGQSLFIIEAMKMQNEIAAAIAGTVSGVRVEPGQAVEARFRFCRIDP